MFSATAVAMQEQVRGVFCVRCGKPVRLSSRLVKRETAMKMNEADPRQQLQSRVFLVRCRACGAESIYALDQIVDLPSL